MRPPSAPALRKQATVRLRVSQAEAQAISLVTDAPGATGSSAQVPDRAALSGVPGADRGNPHLPVEASGVMGSIATMKELFDPAAARPEASAYCATEVGGDFGRHGPAIPTPPIKKRRGGNVLPFSRLTRN